MLGKPLIAMAILIIASSRALCDDPVDALHPVNAEHHEDVSSQQPQPRLFPGNGLLNDHSPFLASVILNRKEPRYHEGEYISVTFQAERAAHLYLIYHQADHRSILLSPNVKDRKTLVAAKTAKPFPAADDYRFRVTPPFGREVIQVIASVSPIPELDELVMANAKIAPAIDQNLLDRLAARLHNVPATWAEHRIVLESHPQSRD